MNLVLIAMPIPHGRNDSGMPFNLGEGQVATIGFDGRVVEYWDSPGDALWKIYVFSHGANDGIRWSA